LELHSTQPVFDILTGKTWAATANARKCKWTLAKSPDFVRLDRFCACEEMCAQANNQALGQENYAKP
jgi:hypothetical protein